MPRQRHTHKPNTRYDYQSIRVKGEHLMNMKNEAIPTSETELKKFVENYSSELFGGISYWVDNNLDAEFERPIRPDFLGRYEDGCYAIVELKMVAKAMESSDRNSYDPMRLVIGQCIHYFHALAERVEASTNLNEDGLRVLSQIFRIYIVTDVYAKPIENMCKLLHAHGFSINYIPVSSLLED